MGWCGIATLGTKDYNQFAVAVWSVIVTALTIGYGDVYAVTHAGRVITTLLALSGIVCVALIVTAVANATQLKADERRAFDAFLRHKMGLERREGAARAAFKAATPRSPSSACA